MPIVDLAAGRARPHPSTRPWSRRSMPGEDARRRPRSSCISNARAATVPVRSSWCSAARRSRNRRRSSVRAAGALRDVPGVLFLSALRRGNVHGAIDAGLAPGFLPGPGVARRGSRVVRVARGARACRGARGSTRAGSSKPRAAGKIEVLVIFGSDPVADFPDADLARTRHRRREEDRSRSAAFLTGPRSAPTSCCPARFGARRRAASTNLEGRVQRVGRKVAPEGTAMDDWRIAGELALRLGADFDLATVDEVTDEIARVAPALAGVDAALLRRARDGVVLPLARAPRRDGAAHAGALDPRRRRFRNLVGPDQGRGRAAVDVAATPRSPTPHATMPTARRERRDRGRGATESSPGPSSWDWDGSVPDIEVPAARRVRSAPRGGSAALRQRTHGQRSARRSSACARPFPLRINPHDAAALGVESGAEVRVTSSRGIVERHRRDRRRRARGHRASSTSPPTARARPS